MRKHKKLVIGAMMAAVLLFGSVVGVAFADDGSNRSVFQEQLAENLGITLEELQAKIAEVRGELPQIDGESRHNRRGPNGGMVNLGKPINVSFCCELLFWF